MPVYTVEIPTPGATVDRQVIHSVVDNLLRNMGINKSDVIITGGAYDNAGQPNSTVGEKREVSFGNASRIFVEVDERRNEYGGFSRAVGYDIEVPLFHDKRYGIKLSPNHVWYDITVTVKRREPARSLLGGWTNELKRKVDMGMDMFVTKADFHYRIPIPALNLLAEAHRAINANLENKESLTSFFKRGFNDGVTIASNDSGKGLTYVCRCTAARIVGSIDNSTIEKTVEGEAGSWISQFTYQFAFARPESIVMSYPVMYNNTLIDEAWWYDSEAPGVSDESYASKGVAVACQDKMAQNPIETVQVPIFIPGADEKRPVNDARRPGELDLFVGYLAFTREDLEGDTHLAFNLADLGDVGFMYSQLTYLRHIARNSPHMTNSMIKVNIFKNGFMFDRRAVAIDQDLNVWMHEEIDITAVYQFSISIDTTLQWLDTTGLNMVADIPTFIGKIILEFCPHLVKKYINYVNCIPMPCHPDSPDLATYPYNIAEPIPRSWVDPIQSFWGELDEMVEYEQYPNKPNLPIRKLPDGSIDIDNPSFVTTIDPDIIDDMVKDTIDSMNDARNPNRDDTLSIYQLNIFNGNIIARRRD